MLNSLLQDGVSNNAGQLVIETVPVQGADCCANSVCAEAGSRTPTHHSGETAYSSADDAHRNNAEQLVAPIWELLLTGSEPLSPECFVQFRRNVRCSKCCTTLLNAKSCGVGRIRSILKHTR